MPSPFADGDALTLDLREPDFTTAQRIARAIGPAAQALDATTVRIAAPPGLAARIALAARIEALDIAVDAPPARVIVNARTGTVVIGTGVRVLPTAIAHGSLTVRVTETLTASQPNPEAGGRTVVLPRSDIAVEAPPARAALFAPGVALADIVRAINALGVAPGDLVAILEALKAAGALRAELVVI